MTSPRGQRMLFLLTFTLSQNAHPMNRYSPISAVRWLCLSFLIATPCLAADRPNVIVIMVDDLGYSDIGCYGGEIDTPNLDALAQNGLRFSQFYNTAKCHSSRVSLLTGQYCIAAGDTSLSHAVTSAEVLGNAGYFTAMTGKWHLKKEPTDFGFQRYFGHLSGACNFFKGDNTFRLNGQKWTVPPKDFYTTVADVDFALDFLDEARTTQKPWYLYVAFNAPHAPLHALSEDYAKYKGGYDEGWDVVRSARVAKQKSLGLLPKELTASPRPEHVPAWDTMEPWRQKYEANRMTTLAAMIDRVDQEIGRLVSDLKANGEFDNTMILFVSDNGACPYDRKAPRLDVEPTNGDVSLADSTGWSWARNSPFRYYKQNQFEGGISTPAIVHWPAGLKTASGTIVDEPAHLIDVLPTLSGITGSDVPASWPNRELRPISGVSLNPIFQGQSFSREKPIHLLFSQDRGLREGDWKAVSFRGESWELYNVANDRTELHNLADVQPERLQRMIATWREMAEETLHAPAKSIGPVHAAKLPHKHPEWTNFANEPGRNPKRQAAKKRNGSRIRARKNTTMEVVGGELRLEFSGDDPGIAMDLRSNALPSGPYVVSFRLKGGTEGDGDLFYTLDPKTILPKGERVSIDVSADDQWKQVTIPLAQQSRLFQLRIDVANGESRATIADLKLTKPDGTTLMEWPAKRTP